MVIRIVILAIGLMLWFDSLAYNQGDIIFQQSQSSQSEFIAEATNSEWTHCGVIYIKDNKEYVLEASNVVKLTPLKEWIQKGKNKKYIVKKVPIKNFEINLNKYLGKKYDLQFDWSDKEMYCSELCPVLKSLYSMAGLEMLIFVDRPCAA